MCKMPRPGGHPLGGAVGDQSAAAVGVLVGEGPVDHVGDGLEAAVGVPGGSLGLAGRVVDLAHLVHVHERVELGEGPAGEGPTDRESLALQPPGAVVTTAPAAAPPGRDREARVVSGLSSRER